MHVARLAPTRLDGNVMSPCEPQAVSARALDLETPTPLSALGCESIQTVGFVADGVWQASWPCPPNARRRDHGKEEP